MEPMGGFLVGRPETGLIPAELTCPLPTLSYKSQAIGKCFWNLKKAHGTPLKNFHDEKDRVSTQALTR